MPDDNGSTQFAQAMNGAGSPCEVARPRGERRRGARVVAMINDLRGPLDALILEGQVLIERLRRLPLRRIAALGDSAEQVLLGAVKLDGLLSEVAIAAGYEGGLAANRVFHGIDAGELSALIEIVVDDAIDGAGGDPEHVELRVDPLPDGWWRISLADTGRGRSDELDFPHLLYTITRCLGDLGLSVVGEIVTAHDGRILAKPRRATTFAA